MFATVAPRRQSRSVNITASLLLHWDYLYSTMDAESAGKRERLFWYSRLQWGKSATSFHLGCKRGKINVIRSFINDGKFILPQYQTSLMVVAVDVQRHTWHAGQTILSFVQVLGSSVGTSGPAYRHRPRMVPGLSKQFIQSSCSAAAQIHFHICSSTLTNCMVSSISPPAFKSLTHYDDLDQFTKRKLARV